MPTTRSTKVSLARAIGLELYTQHKWFAYFIEELKTYVRQGLPAPVCRSRAIVETTRWISTLRPSLDTTEKVHTERQRTMNFIHSGLLELEWIDSTGPKSFFEGRFETFSSENQFLYLHMSRTFEGEVEEDSNNWDNIASTYVDYDLEEEGEPFDLHELLFIHEFGIGWNQQDWNERPLDWEHFNVEHFVEMEQEDRELDSRLNPHSRLIMGEVDRIVVPPLAEDDRETVVEEETKECDEHTPRRTNTIVKLKFKIAKTKLKVALHKLRRPLAF